MKSLTTQTHQQLVSRRTMIFGGVQVAALSMLASRLYYLQFIKSKDLRTRAENNRVKLQLTSPSRGRLYDRHGALLAGNEQNYQLFLDTTGLKTSDKKQAIKTISTVIDLPEMQLETLIKAQKSYAPGRPLLIKEQLAWEEVARLEMHMKEVPHSFIQTGQQRNYPLKDAMGHVLGYMGFVNEEEVKEDRTLLQLPGFKLGKNGIEKQIDQRLRGKAGMKQLEVNAGGLIVRDLKTTRSDPGADTALTLDAKLQAFCVERMGEQSAAVVVMDVNKGDILTMASTPAYDPNVFSRSIPTNYWNSLRNNERAPLLNKAIQGQYPPGSTFKMIVGLAALKAGIATKNSSVHCPGHYYVGRHRFNCWRAGGHGRVNITTALARSCDTYFYSMAEQVGVERIAQMARLFGFGSETNLNLPNEQPGLVPDKAWKRKRYKQAWQVGDTVNVGIGQGYMLATPLQLVQMTAALVGGGQMVTPKLVLDDPVQKTPILGVKPEHLALIKQGMDAAVNWKKGTAYWRRITIEGMEMGGKTGTSQVKKIKKRGMKQELLPWKDRHHALFVGYAPVADPKYAISVIVEHGGGGSSAAAPIAKEVLEFLQKSEI